MKSDPLSVNKRNILQIYAEELELSKLEPSDDFFEVGGNSITMARIQARLKDELGLHVTLETLFTYTTVQTLAKNIE
ncbi:phosphopantetheine-binding protein [Salinisphaera hydrothermalis]|uniref:phosphopantetheine-binding protein n=1 Tax=Salinisphaera hydrothermalis TaxID=563188 RepID=UPI0033429210